MGYSFPRTLCLILAVVTGTTAAEKPLTSLWPLEECTGKSLYIPSWVISQFSSGDEVSFTLINRVTEVSSSITCQDNGECAGASNSDLKVAVQIDEDVVGVTVEDAWTCRDKKTRAGEPKTFHFKAKGNATISLDCKSEDDAQVCASAQDVDLVRGALVEPLYAPTIGPAARATSSNTSTCSTLTDPPSWNLTRIDYQNNTSSNFWVGPALGRVFYMETANHASGDIAKCNNIFTSDPYEPAQTYGRDCWRDPYASWQEPEGTGQLWTTYEFDEVTHDISIKQRWYCDQPKTMKAFVVNGIGSGHVDLDCVTSPGLRGNNTRCSGPTVPLVGEVVSREEIPPFSIQDPYPESVDSGTVGSLVDPYLRFYYGELNTTKGENDTLQAVMYYYLRMPNISLSTIRVNITLSETPGAPPSKVWSSCKGGDFDWNPRCDFRYDYATGEFEVSKDWYTSRANSGREFKFNGTGRTTLQLHCSEVDNGQVCKFDEVTFGLENVHFGPAEEE
ncbi:hypothetical protein GGR52DRAFT_572341 [Hypoxylon sp. FL1284]|nr:hypothetical protein GGR52DRAFT_572341 [Hypoxylon sp. FL1284]